MFLVELIEIIFGRWEISGLYTRTSDSSGPILIGAIKKKGCASLPVLFLDKPAQLYRDTVTGERRLTGYPGKETDHFPVFEADEDDTLRETSSYDRPEKLMIMFGVERQSLVW